MLPLLCRKARRLIADSFNTKEDLIRHFGVAEDRVDVVHLAVSEEFQPVEDTAERERVRARYGLPESFVLFVGSIEPRKNLPWLMRSVKDLRDEGFPHKLVVAGDGEPGFVEELRQTALSLGLSLGEDVVMTGFVEDRDLPALYSCSDLFVFPSIYEGFGLPPLEAMACGVPVLLPENSSFTEYYSDCSLMVDLSEPAVLTEGIRTLLEDSDLCAQLVKKGLERAHSRSWEHVAAETVEVYERAAA
jgi:glycosyltransferase involved in cell wall biosynthesis